MTGGTLDGLPGFRRRFIVSPRPHAVRAAVEDDYHCMAVVLDHDGGRITAVRAEMDRAPWTTCPGAPAVLAATFTGTALAEASRRGEKQANCTHLHDLALLAAAHAEEQDELVYDILVSDPSEGLVRAEIRRNGATMLALAHRDDILVAPEAAAGVSLFALRDWIRALPHALQEPARLLQWGVILAHGRTLPMERQSDASRMPPNCFTFQDARKAGARRVGRVLDFSAGSQVPLDHLAEHGFLPR